MTNNTEASAVSRFTLKMRWQDLGARPSGAIALTQADLTGPKLKQILTFDAGETINDLLAAPLVEVIIDLARRAEERRTGHFDDADLTISLPGLVLSDAGIVTWMDELGTRHFALTFRHVTGGLRMAFVVPVDLGPTTLSHRELLGVRALEDVALPLLTMAQAMAHGTISLADTKTTRKLSERLETIAANAASLEFQASLLSRYVETCKPDWQGQYGAAPDPVQRVMAMSEPPLPAFRPMPPAKQV